MATRRNPPRVYRAQRVVAQLQKEGRPSFRGGSVVNGPIDVVQSMADYIGERATEAFVVLFIDVRNRIVGYTELTEGGVAGVSVDAAGIFREALASGCAAIITIHNHPTGEASPSNEDRRLWARLTDAGALVGVPVLDNFVIGAGEYFSEREGSINKFSSESLR